MDQEVLLALLAKKVEDRLANLPAPSKLRGSRGHRGISGRDGKDFELSEHEEVLRDWVKEFSIKFEDFTLEQISQIRGPKGRDGKDGKDGVNGKDFSLEENKSYLQELAEKFAIKFEDLTPEQISQLRGPQGRDGKDGKDFSLEENQSYLEELAAKFSLKFEDFTPEQISELRGPRGKDGLNGKDFDFSSNREDILNLITLAVQDAKDLLRLKFEDLSLEQIENLRGPKGKDGRDGKGFNFEEHREFFENLKPKFSDFNEEEIGRLKLKFSSLTEEERKSLTLKFSDLTDEEKISLKGSRGQRGRPGIQGRTPEIKVGDGSPTSSAQPGDIYLDALSGDFYQWDSVWAKCGNFKGPIGLRGLPGPVGRSLAGKDGRDGRDGQDGRDAPYVIDVKLDEHRGQIRFIFEYSDGTTLETEYVKLPHMSWTVAGFGSSGDGSASGGGGNSKIPADRIRGRISPGVGPQENLTGEQVAAMLPVFSLDGPGVVPAPTILSGNVLSDTGEWIEVFGTGNVVGPTTAIDGNITIFEGPTGKEIRDSGVSLQDILDDIEDLQEVIPDPINIPFTIEKTQATFDIIPGLSFDGLINSSLAIEFEIHRSDTVANKMCRVTCWIFYKSGVWSLAQGPYNGNNVGGVIFGIDQSGTTARITYKSAGTLFTGTGYEGLGKATVPFDTIIAADTENTFEVNKLETTPVDITGLNLDGDSYSSVAIDFEIHRFDSDKDVMCRLTCWAFFKSGTWQLAQGPYNGNNIGGVIFSIDTVGTAGQVKYISSDSGFTGTGYEGPAKFSIARMTA